MDMEQEPESLWLLPITMEFHTQEDEKIQLNIEFPLLGEYITNNLTEFEKTVKYFEKLVGEKHVGGKGFGAGGYIRTVVAVASLSFPKVPMNNLKFEAYICFLLGWYYYDGVIMRLLKNNQNSIDQKQTFPELCETYEEIWTGKYAVVTDIPQNVPGLSGAYALFHHGQACARNAIPSFVENHGLVRYYVSKYFQSIQLMVLPKYMESFSLESCQVLRNYNFGYGALLEFGFLVSGITLQPKVRDHMLYELIVYLLGVASSLANDIMSIQKDVKSDIKANFVRMFGKREGIELRDAVVKSTNILKELVRDIQGAIEELTKEFPNEIGVEEGLELMKNTFNSSLTYYTLTQRYEGNNVGKPIRRNL